MSKITLFMFVLIIVLMLTGCTNDHLYVERDGVIIEVDIMYFLQDKRVKSLLYDTNTGIIKIESFGSDTSEVVDTFIGYISSVEEGHKNRTVVPIMFR